MAKITKEEIEKLMNIQGLTRGVVFKTDMKFVLKEKGEGDLKKVEEELEKLGYPIKYHEVESIDFYPVGLRALSLLAIKKAFNFSDEKIKKMEFFGTKVSMIVKFFIKYVFSPQKTFKEQTLKTWRKHWTIGNLVPVELNEEKKACNSKIVKFFSPSDLLYLFGGLFCGVLSMPIKTKK